MKKKYILSLIALLFTWSVLAQVTITQSSTEDFIVGHQNNVLVDNGDVFLPEKENGLSEWVSTTNLPIALTGHRIVTWNNWAYLVGGFDGSINKAAVYRSPLQVGGAGSWTNLNNLPVALRDHAVVTGVGYLYVIGGLMDGSPSDQIYYAQINTDGSIGSWNTSSISLPQPLWGHTAKYVNGYIYIVGGANEPGNTNASDKIYYTSVGSNGQLSAFSLTVSLPQARNAHSMVVYNANLYVLGGYNNTGARQNTVYYSGINADGTCTGWLTAEALPTLLSNHSSVCYNGLISVICGDIGGSVPFTRKVYYADVEDAPNFNWIESNYELYTRRKDGQAFVGNGQILYAGGEDLSGTPVSVTRYSALTMTAEKVSHGSFVSSSFIL
nr:hypothetical protein [Bacteroidota bacterium]